MMFWFAESVLQQCDNLFRRDRSHKDLVGLREKRGNAEDPSIASDAERLVIAHHELEQAQEEVDALYQRWAELEGKQ